MRLFERLVVKVEKSEVAKSFIKLDQFAHKENCSTTMALVKCKHNWMNGLIDGDADFVRVMSVDFSKAFDSVSHNSFKLADMAIYRASELATKIQNLRFKQNSYGLMLALLFEF